MDGESEMYLDDMIAAPDAVEIFYEGKIANDATAVTDDLYVRLPQTDEINRPQRLGPCRWSPRAAVGGLLYPTEGDSAIVVKSDIGNLWIISWWPYA